MQVVASKRPLIETRRFPDIVSTGEGVIRRRERLGGVLNYFYRNTAQFEVDRVIAPNEVEIAVVEQRICTGELAQWLPRKARVPYIGTLSCVGATRRLEARELRIQDP